jgi:hypothetical protein
LSKNSNIGGWGWGGGGNWQQLGKVERWKINCEKRQENKKENRDIFAIYDTNWN